MSRRSGGKPDAKETPAMAFRLAPLARDRGSNVIFGLALFVVEGTPIRDTSDGRLHASVPAELVPFRAVCLDA